MKSLFVFSFMLSFVFSYAQTATNKTDEKGLKQGYWVKLDPSNGRPVYKGTFKDDKPVGVFKYYYKDVDTVHTIMEFRKNGTIGYATIFHMNGAKQAKGKYVNEKKDSVWTFYDESGKLLSSESYKEGKRHGKSVVYYQNGEISEERNYKNDIDDGPFKLYYEGKKVKGEGNYINGVLVGKNAYYYPSGSAAAMGNYNNNGDKIGIWLYKDPSGKVTSKEVYDNGKLLSEKEAEEWLKKNKVKEPKEPQVKETKPKQTNNSKGSGKNTSPAKGAKK